MLDGLSPCFDMLERSCISTTSSAPACRLCLDPIPRATFADAWTFDIKTNPWTNPLHPLTVVCNVLWLVFFGWAIVVLFWAAALVQLLTIIAAPTALQMFNLSLFAL